MEITKNEKGKVLEMVKNGIETGNNGKMVQIGNHGKRGKGGGV